MCVQHEIILKKSANLIFALDNKAIVYNIINKSYTKACAKFNIDKGVVLRKGARRFFYLQGFKENRFSHPLEVRLLSTIN